MIPVGRIKDHPAVKVVLGQLSYHAEKNHQGLGNKIIRPEFAEFPRAGEIRCRERLGGMLRYYYRQAA